MDRHNSFTKDRQGRWGEGEVTLSMKNQLRGREIFYGGSGFSVGERWESEMIKGEA